MPLDLSGGKLLVSASPATAVSRTPLIGVFTVEVRQLAIARDRASAAGGCTPLERGGRSGRPRQIAVEAVFGWMPAG